MQLAKVEPVDPKGNLELVVVEVGPVPVCLAALVDAQTFSINVGCNEHINLVPSIIDTESLLVDAREEMATMD